MKIHTKSNIAPLLADISKLKIALADAIRRPMGVIPAWAEGLLTQAELDTAEDRRVSKEDGSDQAEMVHIPERDDHEF